MAWNYRIMRHGDGKAANDEPFYAVHEVHYEADGSVSGWTVEPTGCSGETFDELSRDIAWYLTALVKSILDASTGAEVEPARLLEDDLYAMIASRKLDAAAPAIEARRAETGTGSVHESAVPKGGAR